ncbi:MAG: MFS transporter, partial [Eubacteriales bacterium]
VQFLPMLLFSLYAGTLVDRFPKKKVLIFTQVAMMILAFILALDILMKTVALWHIFVIAALLGLTNTLDMPTRQAFMIELVGKNDLMNAIVLNSSIFNAARVVGPSVAGLLIAKLGIDWCFFLNAASFVPVIAGIAMIRPEEQKHLVTHREQAGVWQEIGAGLSYVRTTSGILVPMTLLAIISVFAMNFNVLVPLYAKNVFHGGAKEFGFLMSATGVGALLGSALLAVRSSGGPKFRTLAIAAATVCVFELLLVPVKAFAAAYLLLGLVGVSMITFTTTSNSLIQVQTPHHLRGRVMSIFALIFAGLTPVGSFLSGSAAHAWGAPVTLGLGALIGLVSVSLLVARFPALFKNTAH